MEPWLDVNVHVKTPLGCAGAVAPARSTSMVAEKGIPDMSQRRRADVGPMALRRRADVGATALRWRCDVGPMSGRRRCDGAATSGRWRCDVGPMSGRRRCDGAATSGRCRGDGAEMAPSPELDRKYCYLQVFSPMKGFICVAGLITGYFYSWRPYSYSGIVKRLRMVYGVQRR